MTLGEKRRQFTLDISILVIWANREGYGLAYDDVKAHDGHMKNSKHYQGLAADLNLYLYIDEKWVYQRSTKAHEEIGQEWKRMGHKWGGDFGKKNGKIGNDGNHYEW